MRITNVFCTECERNVRKSVHKTQKNDIIQAKVDEGDTDNTDAAASHRKDGISYFVCTRVWALVAPSGPEWTQKPARNTSGEGQMLCIDNTPLRN